MFFQNEYFYYITLSLQAICAIHSLRRGTHGKWLWIIIFLPIIGCLIYILTEMFSSSNVRAPKINISGVINPGGHIRKLEEELRFTDTFNNRVRLADAYLAANQVDKAIELYESSLTGAFTENEHVLGQLMIAYYDKGRFTDVINIARKINKQPQFNYSKSHIVYAMALEKAGELQLAEAEFLKMKGRYSNFEQRYQYGLFLIRNNRVQEAVRLFEDILNEESHLSAMEKRSNKVWFSKVKQELKSISA